MGQSNLSLPLGNSVDIDFLQVRFELCDVDLLFEVNVAISWDIPRPDPDSFSNAIELAMSLENTH